MKVSMIENIINHKINTITADELLKYASQYNFSVNRRQAQKIAEYLRGKQINIFDAVQRARVIKEIAKVAGPQTAKAVNKLFINLTR